MNLAFLQQLHGWEMIAILVVALLLFGRRLPEVGRSLGKGIVEFKRGLKGIDDEIESQSSKSGRAADGRASVARPPLTDGGADPRVSRSDDVSHPARPADGTTTT